MFKLAQIRLTILYSTLFLFLFWFFSFGLYEWMNSSVGEGYISQVQQRQGINSDIITDKNAQIVTITGDIELDQLLKILLILNGGLLIVIPITSFFLAKWTLTPVQKIHEQQKQFVSDASHEMRTPLSIISGEIEIALNKKRTAKDYKNTLISTSEETNRLSQLVENLLFLANADQTLHPIPFEVVDITDIVNDVTQALQLKSRQKHISVTLTAENVTNAPTVKGNPSLLRQLFYNLLDNAIIYTPQKGTITLSLSETKNTVSVTIQDTGIGIAKAEQKNIMNRFYRIDTSRSLTKGYGLGLAIVKTIIDKHHGNISIDSKIQQGSTFTIVLPKR